MVIQGFLRFSRQGDLAIGDRQTVKANQFSLYTRRAELGMLPLERRYRSNGRVCDADEKWV